MRPISEASDGSGSTRERLLSIAAALFRSRGYAGTTTRELAANLGMRNASLYHHMGKKEDLLFELSLRALQTISERVSTAMRGADLSDRLHALIKAHLAAALAHQDAHAVMLLELRALSVERRVQVLGLRDEYEALVERTLTDQQLAHIIRADMPARQLTLALLNLLNWTIFWYRPGGEYSQDVLADMLARIFMEGAQARGSTLFTDT